MSDTYNYPAQIERHEDGRHVVAFPDFGWGATDGRPGTKRWKMLRICLGN